jgi:hypothetical protein
LTHQQARAGGDQASYGSHEFVSPEAAVALIMIEGRSAGFPMVAIGVK